jgi:hypothetical protein
MPVTNEHQPKLKLRTGKPFPPRTHLKKFQCKSNGKINFQPPLSDESSDSPAVDSFPFFQGHPKIIPPSHYMENSLFPPPLDHPSSDSHPVNANPCPSVTGIVSNRQNYIQIASPFSRAIRNSFCP